MAFPASGLPVETHIDVYDTTQLALDLDLETHKVALWTDTGTYDLVTDDQYAVAPWNANEITGTGYTAGGVVLTTTVYTHSAGGLVKWDADDPSWTTATFSGVRGAVYYADALAGNNIIVVVNFGGLFQVTVGTFQIQHNAAGIYTIDLIP